MVRRTTHRQGYTLIEMMLVVVIVGAVVFVGPTLFTQLIRFYQLHNAKVEIQRDARACLDLINRFLRQAQSNSVVIDQATGQPPYSRISFTTIEGQNVMFYQKGNTLFQVAQSTSAISNNLHYIAFTYPRSDNPGIISVALTMEKNTYQGQFKALELSIQQVRVMD